MSLFTALLLWCADGATTDKFFFFFFPQFPFKMSCEVCVQFWVMEWSCISEEQVFCFWVHVIACPQTAPDALCVPSLVVWVMVYAVRL